MLRKNFDIKTICMHGSPRSKYDNKIIWEKYDYKKLGILGEPYFDIDFNKVFYITDASRSWNNKKVNRRDKVNTNYNILIKSTSEIINLINSNNIPSQIMINTHPHNWSDSFIEWNKILLWQSIKNIVKRLIIKYETITQ